MKPSARVCSVCGKPGPVDGPLGYAWDWHVVDGAMVASCSPECRAARGWRERKVGA